MTLENPVGGHGLADAYKVSMLPGGQAVLFTLIPDASKTNQTQVVLQSLRTGERKLLVQGGIGARYLPTGHLVYGIRGTLFAAAFDPKRLEFSGNPIPVVQGVTQSGCCLSFSVADNGTLVYIPGLVRTSDNPNSSTIGFMDRNGNVKPLNLMPDTYVLPRLSPDGERIAFGIDDGKEANIMVYDLSGTAAPRRLTFAGANRDPICCAVANASRSNLTVKAIWAYSGRPQTEPVPQHG